MYFRVPSRSSGGLFRNAGDMEVAPVMRLAKLTLTGFKSFADRTEFRFDDPITGIVGPNGCGKSNVVDAIKWVLGERSSKSLRGKEMTDVIFAGSAGRRPLGMASVTLTFDNPINVGPPRYGALSHRNGTFNGTLSAREGRLPLPSSPLASKHERPPAPPLAPETTMSTINLPTTNIPGLSTANPSSEVKPAQMVRKLRTAKESKNGWWWGTGRR